MLTNVHFVQWEPTVTLMMLNRVLTVQQGRPPPKKEVTIVHCVT